MTSHDYSSTTVNRHQDAHYDSEEKLRYELAKTVTLTPELYERLFLNPKTRVSGDLRSRFGNPTPVGVLGFSIAVMPLACAFSTSIIISTPSRLASMCLTTTVVGWQGSGGLSVATGTVNIFFGGMLLILAGIGEFLLGNTFPMMVFLGYGAHFFAYATTFVPAFNSIGYFNPDGSGTGSPGTSNQTSVFLASYGK